MKKSLPLLLLLLGSTLAGCSSPTAENAETEKRIATCQEVMKIYIKQANTYERDQKRLIGTCHMSQKERTLKQWQCALAGMQKGEGYEAASDRCGKTSVGHI